jgi:hypothetical protein
MGQDQSQGHRAYTYIESARGVTQEGIEASFVTYESSDGITLFVRTEHFVSTAEAATQFEMKTNSLSEILERRNLQDVKGDSRGERVVGRHRNKDGQEIYSVIWSHGTRISYLESVSLDHVLDFEKRSYKSAN